MTPGPGEAAAHQWCIGSSMHHSFPQQSRQRTHTREFAVIVKCLPPGLSAKLAKLPNHYAGFASPPTYSCLALSEGLRRRGTRVACGEVHCRKTLGSLAQLAVRCQLLLPCCSDFFHKVKFGCSHRLTATESCANPLALRLDSGIYNIIDDPHLA